MRYDEERLRDILEAIAAIERRVGNDRSAFDSDELLRVWCLHHLTIIGEAAARVAEPARARYPAVPWREIAGMRNAIVHGYFDVDWDEVWNTVQRDLAPLRVSIKSILSEEGSEA